MQLTVDGVVVGVLGSRTARLELLGRRRVNGHSVRPEETVHVAFAILAGEHDRINVFKHEPVRGCDGVGRDGAGAGKEEGN